MHQCLRHGEEDAAKAILQTDYETRGTEESEYGGNDSEMGRRRNLEEGCIGDAAEEQIEETEIGKVERSVDQRIFEIRETDS